jgi:hypothetical protein
MITTLRWHAIYAMAALNLYLAAALLIVVGVTLG